MNLWENLQDFTSQEIAVSQVTAFKDLKFHSLVSLFTCSCKSVVALCVSYSQFSVHLFSFYVLFLKIWTTSVIVPRNSQLRLPLRILLSSQTLHENKIHLHGVLHSHGICLHFSYLSVSSSLCLFPKQVTQAAMLLTCILGVSNLNLCPDSCYPGKVIFMNISDCAGGFRFCTPVSPRVSDSFQILYNS